MTKSKSLLALALLMAVSTVTSARAQEARKPEPPPATKQAEPMEREKRDAARLLLLAGGKSTSTVTAQKAQTAQSMQAAATSTTGTQSSGVNNANTQRTTNVVTTQQPTHQSVDPVTQAHAESIRLQNEGYRRQMDREDAFAYADLAQREEGLRQQQAFADQQLAAGWQALDTDLANQYQNLAYQDQALAANQIGLQSAVVNNRQQYYAYKSFRQWDNLNRSMTVWGGSLGQFSGLAAGITNHVYHGHEDHIDDQFEGQFNQQQSAMLSDIDSSRKTQVETREELRNNLRMRMEALKARQAALRPAPQPTTTNQSPSSQQP